METFKLRHLVQPRYQSREKEDVLVADSKMHGPGAFTARSSQTSHVPCRLIWSITTTPTSNDCFMLSHACPSPSHCTYSQNTVTSTVQYLSSAHQRIDTYEVPPFSPCSTMLLQPCHNVVAFLLQRYLQWGPTQIVLGIYNRTMVQQ